MLQSVKHSDYYMMVTDSINVKEKHLFSKLKLFIDLFFGSSNHIFFDIHMSVHRNIIPSYGQRDATCL